MLQALPYYFDDIQRAIADMEPKHLILCGAVVPCRLRTTTLTSWRLLRRCGLADGGIELSAQTRRLATQR